jgi:DNA replication and repair protein RecF
MYITRLSLTNFRNFSRLDLHASPGKILLLGGNAQGKTSLLEAIYYTSTFFSFQAENDKQLINFLVEDEPLLVTRLITDFIALGNLHQIEVRLITDLSSQNNHTRFRKEILEDGAKRKLSEAIGFMQVVLFLPQMMQIIEGSPDNRRRFINLVLSQVISHYNVALSQYTNALTQRNALLKMLSERGGDISQLDYWDEQLSNFGSFIIYQRIQALNEFEKIALPILRELTHGSEILRIVYKPSIDPLPKTSNQMSLPIDLTQIRNDMSLDSIQQIIVQSLSEHRSDDIARGITLLGPHRDELRFLTNGIDLGHYGSRGQIRTLLLALKLTETIWMKEKTGNWPILLLDEILAELDVQRRMDFLSRMSDCEQVFLTTTDAELFPKNFINGAHVWQVRNGRINQEENGS